MHSSLSFIRWVVCNIETSINNHYQMDSKKKRKLFSLIVCLQHRIVFIPYEMHLVSLLELLLCGWNKVLISYYIIFNLTLKYYFFIWMKYLYFHMFAGYKSRWWMDYKIQLIPYHKPNGQKQRRTLLCRQFSFRRNGSWKTHRRSFV